MDTIKNNFLKNLKINMSNFKESEERQAELFYHEAKTLGLVTQKSLQEELQKQTEAIVKTLK